MPHRELPPALLEEIRSLAANWGKIVSRRAFGDDGPGLDIDLDTMEQVVHAAAAGLSEGALALFLEQQAQTLGPQQPCPACGTVCPVRREPRLLTTREAALPTSEPVCHCPACRRDFFPPTTDPSPRRARVQPRRLAPDC